MFDGILEYLTEFGLWLIEQFKDFVLWLLNWLIEAFNDNIYPILEFIVDKIGPIVPADWTAPLQEFLRWMGIINCWVPVDFGFMLLTAYYSIKLIAMIFKWIANIVLSIIP